MTIYSKIIIPIVLVLFTLGCSHLQNAPSKDIVRHNNSKNAREFSSTMNTTNASDIPYIAINAIKTGGEITTTKSNVVHFQPIFINFTSQSPNLGFTPNYDFKSNISFYKADDTEILNHPVVTKAQMISPTKLEIDLADSNGGNDISNAYAEIRIHGFYQAHGVFAYVDTITNNTILPSGLTGYAGDMAYGPASGSLNIAVVGVMQLDISSKWINHQTGYLFRQDETIRLTSNSTHLKGVSPGWKWDIVGNDMYNNTYSTGSSKNRGAAGADILTTAPNGIEDLVWGVNYGGNGSFIIHLNNFRRFLRDSQNKDNCDKLKRLFYKTLNFTYNDNNLSKNTISVGAENPIDPSNKIALSLIVNN